MKLNKLKGLAAIFILSGIVVVFINDLKYTATALILKSIGLSLFFFAIIKESKKRKI